ncbi:MAG: sodium:proline symporter [Phycisphaeraceae bacterium]|nr:MAG: sodium:proline symporter [Phycisphaeraceae bacterium]
MPITADSVWKLVAVAIYAFVLLVIGYFASRGMRNIRDYFAAGKNLGFITAAFSARATGESAWLLLGLTGVGFAVGAQGFWIVLGEIIGVGGAWLFLARRFKRLSDKYDAITMPDYLEGRLRDSGHTLRLIAAGALFVFVPIYAGSQIFATGGAFHSFLGWNHFVGATVGFVVVLLYITRGGFVAVVWSDVFQGTLMGIGLVALPIVGILEAGGVTHILDALRDVDPHLLTLHGPGPAPEVAEGMSYIEPVPSTGGWNALTITTIIGFAAIGIGFLGSPQVFVRFIALRSEKEIRKGAAVALLWTILADSGAVLVGMVGRGMYEWSQIAAKPGFVVAGDKERILPFMAEELLPSFLTGVFIAMVLSAIMSTIDSLLVVASSAGVRDYWQKIKRPDLPDERLVRLSELVTLGLAMVAYAIGIGLLLNNRDKQIFWVIIFGWSGIAATFCPTVILSLFWRGLTASGAKAAMFAGFLGVPFFAFAAGPALTAMGWDTAAAHLGALDVLLPAFVVSFVVAVGVSLADSKGRARLAGVEDELAEAGRRG